MSQLLSTGAVSLYFLADKSSVKVHRRLKSLHLFPRFHFRVLRVVLIYKEGVNKTAVSYGPRGPLRRKFCPFTVTGFSFSPFIALLTDIWSAVFTLFLELTWLQCIDNDSSHIYCLNLESHLAYADKPPEK